MRSATQRDGRQIGLAQIIDPWSQSSFWAIENWVFLRKFVCQGEPIDPAIKHWTFPLRHAARSRSIHAACGFCDYASLRAEWQHL